MFYDTDTGVLHEALSEMAPDAFAALERSYRKELELVAFDVVEDQRERKEQEKQERRREIAHKQAARLQEKWDRQIAILRRIQADALELAERYPEYVAFSDEPDVPSTPTEEDIATVMEEAVTEHPRQPSLAERMARSFNRNQRRISERLAS